MTLFKYTLDRELAINSGAPGRFAWWPRQLPPGVLAFPTYESSLTSSRSDLESISL